MRKKMAIILASVMAFSSITGCSNSDESGVEPGTDTINELIIEVNTFDYSVVSDDYNELQEIVILKDTTPSGSYFPKFEPLEEGSIYPSVKLTNGLFTVVLRGWATTDLSLYAENGYIQLDARSDSDNADFEIGFDELINGAAVSYTINVDEVIDIGSEWATYRIPLKDILRNTDADMSTVRQFLIGNSADGVYVRCISIISPDKEKTYPLIKVNQLGYKPDSEKTALISGFYEQITEIDSGTSFEIVDHSTEKTVYESQLTSVTPYDEKYSGEKILSADFTEFNECGTYYLRIKDSNGNTNESVSFTISDSVYSDLMYDTMRYFYYQRANTEITEEYGGEYVRSDMTPKDFSAPLSSDRDILLDVSGGWYDAGDIGKYVCPGATAVNTLLWAYKMFPEKFYDGQNNIPEGVNGIPDILDEIRYELDFLLRMQDTASGGFYLKVKSRSESDSDGDRTVWNGMGDKCLTNATADASAVLAFASMIYREFDADYADKMLEAAVNGWKYIAANPDIYTKTTYSGENNNSSTFWAAACLYYATGDTVYNDYFISEYNNNIKAFKVGTNGHSVSDMAIYGYYTYLLSENKDAELVSDISRRFENWKKVLTDRYAENPWSISLPEWSFWWGSFNLILGNPQDIYIGNALLGNDNSETVKMSQDAVNFILGENAMSKSYITGEGENAIKCTFSTFYDGNSDKGVPSGYMPGGINAADGSLISRFPLKCYTDDAGDWFTNENAIYWNAVMVFNAALVS